MKYIFVFGLFIFLLGSCMEPVERNCATHKNGTYTFTMVLDNDSVSTTFTRKDNLEIDRFNGKVDSSSVRWINDCEYVLKNLNPKNREEEKAIHIKILSTTDSSYTFEFGAVGETNKLRGTAIKKH